MKALITGSTGFVGGHLINEFEANGYEVIRCSHSSRDGYIPMNIMDQEEIQSIIKHHAPDILINMAGQANVGLSWKKPRLTVELNTIGLINILEAVKAEKPSIKVVAIGSSDEYGSLGNLGTNVTEEMPVKPLTPYAVSKVAQEILAQLYARSYGMNICMVRQFNLGGAGQKKGYMISDFASGIAEIEAGKREYLSVGNLESARDFTHVKDACRAIRLIAEEGHPGEIYNLSSGITYTAQAILDKLTAMSTCHIEVRKDPARMRPSDTPVICGNHSKLTAHTGWRPEYSIDDILADVLKYWRECVSEESHN